MALKALTWACCLILAGTVGPDAFTSGGWQGEPHFDSDGHFANCTVRAPEKAGTKFSMIKRVPSRLGLIVSDEALSLRRGAKIAVFLQANGEDTIPALAQVLERDGIVIPLAVDNPVIPAIRKGEDLHVSFVGSEFDFKLKGVGAALDALQACFTTNQGATRFDL